ncbi:ABC transporter permease [Mesobacillus zeae]|uniref:ABC transporter permease n=1 Tax=Mesobacillus zeae TaxID=1917180 RepID=A0A398BAP9_9BACI|nr:FtsX-like permease family protein [Mesobacillus zeae]RID86634.1 ABC transporter permease [Mesobacillus zeae]
MIGRMLKKDLLRNRIITLTLSAFIMLSSLLIASAVGIMVDLFVSMDKLFQKSNAPHFVQMHSGEIDQRLIDKFSFDNELVKEQQTVEMINIDGSNIFLNESQRAENESVMDISFVKQNPSFDFLLNLENQVIKVSQGEIGVPIYYMQQNDLNIGDKIWVANGNFKKEFMIKAFVRDVQMNPSIVSSKRFVINDQDWNIVKANIGESEYLIEFLLTDLDKITEFESMYQSADLPQKGPKITYSLFKTLNALSEGIVALVIVLISLLLIAIAILCIRFTMMTTMEEDYREIGVMKGIGIQSKDIQKLYLTKYIVIAAVASIGGFVLSIFVGHIFTANIALYMGTAEKTVLHYFVPLIGTMVVFIAVLFYCQLVLRKFRRITAIEALRAGSSLDNRQSWRVFKLQKSKFPNVNVFLGIKDVFERFKVYGLVCFVFILSTFIIIVPVNFLNTVESPGFITYMGAGKSDIRIDLQQSMDVGQRFTDMQYYIENDSTVEKYSALVTSTIKILNSEGTYENINVEIGDFTVFPLEYLKGSAPKHKNDIALSYMKANELEKNVGDVLVLIVNGQKQELTICGIYQDISNGGKTAKALLPYDSKNILWYVVNLDVKTGVDVNEKIEEYKKVFYPAKVTDMDEYLSQTLGTTINQLKVVTVSSIVIAISIAVLITGMFFTMLIAKDAIQITIMKSLGFSNRDIQVQYITRSLLVLLIGIVFGTFIAGTLGQELVSLLGSFMGASNIKFVVNSLVSYILCPLLLIIAVTITTLINSMEIKKRGDFKIKAE